MTRKRAIKYLMGVAHFDRNTIQKAFADTHKKVPGSSNVQIAAILLENWEDAAIAAHNINAGHAESYSKDPDTYEKTVKEFIQKHL